MPLHHALEHLSELLMSGQLTIERGALEKHLVGATADDLAVLKNDNQVAVDHGRQPVSDNEQGSVLSN